MLSREARREQRAPVLALRQLTFAFVLALALAVATSGCGDSDDPDPGGGSADGESSLTVTLDTDGPDGPKPARSEDVSCAEGSESAVCQALAELDLEALEPVPPDTACTQIYGGPDTASLEGSVRGETVDVELTRQNGCEIARFDAAVPLLQHLFPGYQPGQALSAPGDQR